MISAMEGTERLGALLGPVSDQARRLAEELDVGEAADWVSDQCLYLVFSDRADDPEFRAALHRTAYENLDAMWRIISGRANLQSSIPYGAATFAEMAAELGVPLDQFHRVYRLGSAVVWAYWYRQAMAYAERTGTPPAELLGAPNMMIHAYLDRLLGEMLARYDETLAEALRTRSHLRRSVLKQVLDGSVVLTSSELEEALGVTRDAEHVAFVVRSDREPERLATHVAIACDVTTTLHYRYGVRDWVVWLSRPGGFEDRRLRALRDALERTGERIAVGTPTRGVQELGATGRDAIEAARMQNLLGDDTPRVLSFDDVRLEALFLDEPDRARRFVEDELAGLDADEERISRLRDTARTWLLSGSHVTTAAQLGLHEHTVRNRIAQAEELLGRTLVSRRTELLVALRLKRMLSAEPRQPPRVP